MDWLPILFDAQLILIVVVLVAWALHKQPEKRRERRRKAGIRCTDGKVVGKRPTPAMTAEEIVKVCNSL